MRIRHFRVDTDILLLYNSCIEVYNLTCKISEQEIVVIHTFFQRVDDREFRRCEDRRRAYCEWSCESPPKAFVSRLERLPPLYG